MDELGVGDEVQEVERLRKQQQRRRRKQRRIRQRDDGADGANVARLLVGLVVGRGLPRGLIGRAGRGEAGVMSDCAATA